MRILSLDPGETSGWALVESDDKTGEIQDIKQWVTYGGVDGVADQFWDSKYPAHDAFIIERYVVRPNHPGNPVAIEVIGFVKGTYEHPDEIIWRLRSDKGKAGFVDGILKRHGLWLKGKVGRHMNDALIHILTWRGLKMKHEPTVARYFSDE